MNKIQLIISFLFISVAISSANALDASADGEWISMGVPRYFHMGTDGAFYINGTNPGKCSDVTPGYFRVNMSEEHFDKFYSWLLLMSVKKNGMDCRVDTGCGSNQVWVSYCRGSLD